MADIESIKRSLEILDDPIIGMVGAPKWRCLLKLTLLAEENGQGGLLPPVADCARHLKVSEKILKKMLHRLSKLGEGHETHQGWVVNYLQENQSSSGSDKPIRLPRKRHTSAAQRNKQGEGSSKQAFPFYD